MPSELAKLHEMERSIEGTLLQTIATHARERGANRALAFLNSALEIEMELSFADLHATIAAGARDYARVLPWGARVILLCEPGAALATSFFACMAAGAIPAPVHVPRPKHGVERLEGIVVSSGCAAVICDDAGRRLLETSPEAAGLFADCLVLPPPAIVRGSALTSPPLSERVNELAFVQFTSGSTSSPKGVAVSHRNIMANQKMIRDAFGHDDDTVVGTWLPMFHDMGLVGTIMQPLFLGRPCYYLSPAHFLQRPLRWLAMNARYGVTTSGAPNFAYGQIAQKVLPKDLEQLDLTRWTVAFNGAEPVKPDVFRTFANLLKPTGFDVGALFPCYGMSEAALFVSGSRSKTFKTQSLDIDDLAKGQATAADGAAGCVEVTSCGAVAGHGQEVRIDAESASGEGSLAIGEICLRGPHIASGYFSAEAPTGVTPLRTKWLDGEAWFGTGDLGYLSGDDLYVVGREKDLIIVNGRNVHPHDLEAAATRVFSAFARTSVTACAVGGALTEKVVLVVEAERALPSAEERLAMLDDLREALARTFDVTIADLVFTRRGSVPRTTSGKVRRGECSRLLAENAF